MPAEIKTLIDTVMEAIRAWFADVVGDLWIFHDPSVIDD